MPRAPRIEYPGAIHHVSARGNRRLPVFDRQDDYELYLHLLSEVAERQHWRMLSYCLMPNHVHLLVQTPVPNLSEGMRRLSGTYTRRYNDGRGISGHVFEGRFKNKLVRSDEHLITAFAYIALNPVKPGLCGDALDWEWSAHGELAGRRQVANPPILAVDALSCFGTDRDRARDRYLRFVQSYADMVATEDVQPENREPG